MKTSSGPSLVGGGVVGRMSRRPRTMQYDAKQLIVAQVPAGSGLVVRGEEGRLGHAYNPGRRGEGACSWTGGG